MQIYLVMNKIYEKNRMEYDESRINIICFVSYFGTNIIGYGYNI